MSRPVSVVDGVDPTTVAFVNAPVHEIQRVGHEQKAQRDLASRAGEREGRISLALLLAALALSVCALAGRGERNGRGPVDLVATLLVAGSLMAAASTVFA